MLPLMDQWVVVGGNKVEVDGLHATLFIYFPGVLLNRLKTGFSFPVFGAR